MFNKVVTRVRLDNLGPLDYLEWSNVGSINLIIGRNGTGKTLLLKAIYASLKSLERFKRGSEADALEKILGDQLRRTFQGDRLGDLVRKGEKDGLRVAVDLGEERLSFQIAAKSDALKSVSLVADRNVYQEDSIFIPAKEILTLGRLVLETRERDHPLGFDGTYCDLAQYLQPALFEECPREMKKICADLKKIAGGQAKMCVNSHSWYFFDKNGCRYPLELVGEGTKKLALLRWLLLTRFKLGLRPPSRRTGSRDLPVRRFATLGYFLPSRRVRNSNIRRDAFLFHDQEGATSRSQTRAQYSYAVAQ